MRLIVWMLGVMCTLEALMTARAIAPGWVWVFWVWLGLWVVVGAVVLAAALLRGAALSRSAGVPRVAAPLPGPTGKAPGGE